MNDNLKMELEELQAMLLDDASRCIEKIGFVYYDNADCARILRNIAADLEEIIQRHSA